MQAGPLAGRGAPAKLARALDLQRLLLRQFVGCSTIASMLVSTGSVHLIPGACLICLWIDCASIPVVKVLKHTMLSCTRCIVEYDAPYLSAGEDFCMLLLVARVTWPSTRSTHCQCEQE